MSQFDVTAQSALTFTEMAEWRLAGTVQQIGSSGYGRSGLGAGAYVSDDRATAALCAAHPAACFRGDGNRYFRLVPDAQGMITPEQMGCPDHAPGVDARPYWQAALDYAHAMRGAGVRGVAAGQAEYEIRAPLRNADAEKGSPNARSGTADLSGFPLLIRSRVELRAAPDGTTFRRRKFDGSDPNVWAGTQRLAGGGDWRASTSGDGGGSWAGSRAPGYRTGA